MRLIDADALVAQEEFFAKTFKGDFGELVATHVIEVINNAPTVDAVPVIRCKDCKRFYQNDQSASQCKYSGNKDGYCFMAERKEE